MQTLLLLVVFAFANLAVADPGAHGDPHFTGWDGVNFDFTGEPGQVYCMISDELFHMNMKLCGRAKLLGGGRIKPQTWIKELGFMYRGHRVAMAARDGADLLHKASFLSTLQVNGEDVALHREKDQFRSADKGVLIQYDKRGSHGVMQFDLYKLVFGYKNEEIVLLVKAGPEVPEERENACDAFVHLSVEVVGGRPDFWTGGVHGILGQTLLNARGRSRLRGNGSYKTEWNPLLVQMQVAGLNGDGYLDGNVSDYVSSGLLHSDCRFARFNPNLVTTSPPLITVSSGYSRRFLPGSFPYNEN
ncbi:hypothetical protein L7F22_064921 [Adiantum nelumboides]|nr:hypothetical protein [Adiantum nelumboides]MCO5610680.1 hypothetical protein [Adiantum nelumboides]